MNYEFQFSISENESNKDVQKRLAKLINHTNIGVRAVWMREKPAVP